MENHSGFQVGLKGGGTQLFEFFFFLVRISGRSGHGLDEKDHHFFAELFFGFVFIPASLETLVESLNWTPLLITASWNFFQ